MPDGAPAGFVQGFGCIRLETSKEFRIISSVLTMVDSFGAALAGVKVDLYEL